MLKGGEGLLASWTGGLTMVNKVLNTIETEPVATGSLGPFLELTITDLTVNLSFLFSQMLLDFGPLLLGLGGLSMIRFLNLFGIVELADTVLTDWVAVFPVNVLDLHLIVALDAIGLLGGSGGGLTVLRLDLGHHYFLGMVCFGCKFVML